MGGGAVAFIDDGRAQLLAGQAQRMKLDSEEAAELLRRGKLDEAARMLDRNRAYANAIWHELDLLTRPPRNALMRGKSRGR